MGLAASQARYLGLTARKSNIEYEGQQVNQQRTALAEEVNSLYTQLLSLSSPIAPDVSDYYETNYSFELDNTSDYDGSYVVKSYYQNDDGTYYLNTERTYSKNVAVGTVMTNTSITTSTDDDGNTVYTINTTDGSYTLSAASNGSSMISLINSTYGDDTISEDDSMYYYQDSDGLTHYVSASAIQDYLENGTDFSSYYSSTKEVTETVVFENATVTFDENNRFSTISAVDAASGESLFSTTSVDTTRTYDSDAYDAALRDYTMSQDEYEKRIAELNAKTESLQQEDKVLELRLDQIDTEQSELQTELDAVKEILDKNIENTFNTFT